MLKNACFLEKTVKFVSASGAPPPNLRLPPAAGGSAHRPQRCYSRLQLQLCRRAFLALSVVYDPPKRTK